MYRSFYRLKHKPFQISTDPSFLWLGEKHEEALATLRYGILDNKGFLLLTGDVGTGKTTLINALLGSLGGIAITATIRDPDLDPMDFYHYIAHSFGMPLSFSSKGTFLIEFERFLHRASNANKKVLLIIDEAQRINQKLLEDVRLLSNIEKNGLKLLNIFFVGQTEFNGILLRQENRAIRQRITVNYSILPLTRNETEEYIQYRLKIAGSEEKLFSKKAFDRIFAFSNGYPRLINIICDRCLLTGFVANVKLLSDNHVDECIGELTISENTLEKPTSLTSQATTIGHGSAPVRDEQPKSSPQPISAAMRDNTLFPLVIKTLTFLTVLTATAVIVLFYLFPEKFKFLVTSDVERYLSNVMSKYYPPGETERSVARQDKLMTPDSAPPDSTVTPSPSIIHGEAPSIKETTVTKDSESTTREFTEAQLKDIEKIIIPFPSDSNLPALQSVGAIDDLISLLHVFPQYKVSVKGYTDALGNESYNKKLSEFRANTVKSFLTGKGLAESRIIAQGLGSANPIASNDNPKARVDNRRVEIELLR